MSGPLVGITAFRLTTAEPARLARFYAAIGFTIGEAASIAADEMALLGLHGGGARLTLHLGPQRIDLDSFELPGRPYPPGATAADRAFQHFAIVTSDAAAAWERARAAGAIAISRGHVVSLPAASGGVAAIKFRDPEGHPLEFLQYPAGADHGWTGSGMLGIDHSAISVGDRAASCRFYEALGLAVAAPSRNTGPAQVALDGLDGVDVDVVPMLPRTATPHLELLAYRHPRGKPAGRLAANDVAATRFVWLADREALVRDPDGHLHLLRRGPMTSSA